MVKLFRHNEVLQVALILLLMAAQWAVSIVHPPQMEQTGGGIIYDFISSLMQGTPRLATIVAIALLISEGFYLNVLLVGCQAIPVNTMMPMLLYVLTMGAQHGAQTITPLLLVNLLLLGMLHLLLIRTDLPILSNASLFSIAALIGIALMVSPYAWVLFILLLAVILIFKIYSLREWALIALGFLAPVIIWLLGYFLCDQLPQALRSVWLQIASAHLMVVEPPLTTFVANALFLSFILLSLIVGPSLRDNRITVNDINNTLLFMPFVCGMVACIYDAFFPVNLQTFAVFFAYAGSLMFLGIKRKWLANTLFLLFVALSVIMPYIDFVQF